MPQRQPTHNRTTNSSRLTPPREGATGKVEGVSGSAALSSAVHLAARIASTVRCGRAIRPAKKPPDTLHNDILHCRRWQNNGVGQRCVAFSCVGDPAFFL